MLISSGECFHRFILEDKDAKGGALSCSPTSSDIQSIVQAGAKASYSSTSTGATHLRSDGTCATLPSGSYQRLLSWVN